MTSGLTDILVLLEPFRLASLTLLQQAVPHVKCPLCPNSSVSGADKVCSSIYGPLMAGKRPLLDHAALRKVHIRPCRAYPSAMRSLRLFSVALCFSFATDPVFLDAEGSGSSCAARCSAGTWTGERGLCPVLAATLRACLQAQHLQGQTHEAGVSCAVRLAGAARGLNMPLMAFWFRNKEVMAQAARSAPVRANTQGRPALRAPWLANAARCSDTTLPTLNIPSRCLTMAHTEKAGL